MTLQLELSKNTEQILTRDAMQHGMQPAEYAVFVLEQSLKPKTGIELLEQWLNDKNPEHQREQNETFSELQDNLDQHRIHAARKLFPK
jgi:hypothetical protein